MVPALTKSLKDPDREVKTSTIRSLELFGSDAKPAVSALIQSLYDQDPVVRKHAQLALAKIDPEAATKLGLRTNELQLGREGWEFVK